MTSGLHEVVERLRTAYSAERGRAGASPIEKLIAAVLIQGTDWRKVERTIDTLRENGLLELRRLHVLPAEELAEWIRPAGGPAVKTKRLRSALRLAVEHYDGDLEAMFATSPATLRDELLEVRGIGPETADAILLYAAEAPKFPVATGAHRVAARHGWVEFDADYETIREYFESGLEPDAERYNEAKSLLDRVAKEHCRATPICEGCPLAEWLPEGRDGVKRPLEPESFG